MSPTVGDPAIARTELSDWHDEMRERVYAARFSLALADMRKETTMSNEGPLPRGPFVEEEVSDAVEPPDLNAELAEVVIHLAICRDDVEAMKRSVANLHEGLMATDIGKRYGDATESLSKIKVDVKDAESEVRSLAVQIHAETDERKPHEAITIKQYNTPVITDETLLLEHVRIHAPQCVKLDTRQVTKLARAGLVLPGIILEDEYRATIARDLGKWLPEEEPK